MPARRTRIKTSWMPIPGSGISSSHKPGSRLLLTSAFMNLSLQHEHYGERIQVQKRQLRFLGLEAGGESKPSGLATLQWDGRTLRLTQLDCLDEPDDIIQWAADTAGNDAVIGIDAPTVVPVDAPDAGTLRSADRLAHSAYDKYHAGPSSTSLSLTVRHRTTRLSSELSNLRFLHGDQLTPQSHGRHQIEVHPPAAAVQLFMLARVIRYRRGTIAERKAGLQLLRGLMLDHFPRLFPKLALTELPEVPTNARDLKALEHRLDSLM